MKEDDVNSLGSYFLPSYCPSSTKYWDGRVLHRICEWNPYSETHDDDDSSYYSSHSGAALAVVALYEATRRYRYCKDAITASFMLFTVNSSAEQYPLECLLGQWPPRHFLLFC